MGEPGRPEHTEQDFQRWLDDMAPFFKLGATLNSAIEDAELVKYRTAIYGKYKLNDWFSEQINRYREYPGKLINRVIIRRVMEVDEKIRQGLLVTEFEMKDVRFAAEKHRSAQPYFVNRTETKAIDDENIGKIIDDLDSIDDVAEQAKKSMVEADPPVQNQE